MYDDSSLVIRNNTIGAGNDSNGDPYGGNDEEGIYIDYVEYSSTAEITGNVMVGNGSNAAIYINEVYDESSVSIICNDILDNLSSGIWVEELYDDGSSVVIHGNNIVGNTNYGLDYSDSTYLDATNNWWGDASGPSGDGPGSGDEISGDVDYDPWLTTEAGDGKSEETVSGMVTIDAKDEAGTEVVKSGSGTPTVTTFEYTSNPGGTTTSGFTSLGKYIDVHVDDATDVNEIEIRNYYTSAEITGLDEANLTLAWWDGAAWVECSDSGATYPAGGPTYKGYVWAKIRTDTTPTLAELTGTAFMSMGTPPAPAPPSSSGDGEEEPNITISLTDLVSSRSLIVDYRGIVLYDSQLKTTDGKFTLDIAKNTKLLDSQSKPLKSLSVATEASPPALPSGNAIVMAYNFGPDGATLNPAITLTATYDPQGLPEGVAEDDLYIAYWDGSQWLTLETTVNTEANTVSCQLSHFTTFAVIGTITPPSTPAPPAPPSPAPAVFSISNLTIQPTEVPPKQTITITVSVANTGGTEGSYTVVLKINGVKETEKSVTIAANSSQEVSFSVARADASSYNVVVDGLSGSFTVATPAQPAEEKPEVVPEVPAQPAEEKPEAVPEVPVTPTPVAWWVWLIVGIVTAAVIGVIVWQVGLRRRV